jgi:hypothetical protein
VRLLRRTCLLGLTFVAMPLSAARLAPDEHPVYAVDSNGRVTAQTSDGKSLVALFERHPPVSFARAADIYTYLPLGDMKFLVTTEGSHPRTIGVFVADLGADSLEQVVWGDYTVEESHERSGGGRWFLIKSVGGSRGTFGEN